MSENKYEVVKFIDDNIELDVNIDTYSETIWLTQSQMAILFGVDISWISRHIKNALNEEEINLKRNLRKTQIANSDKLVYLYDLVEETDEKYINELLKYGYLKQEKEKNVPNIVIFNQGKVDIKQLKNYEKISKLRKEITELIGKAKDISRGYIIDQALDLGWLKHDENTINTVGAYIYK